jgi:type IV secretory pathway VirJ component
MRIGLWTGLIILACAAGNGQPATPETVKNQAPPVPGLADLPLTEIPAMAGSSGFLAVHLTGDGGYGGTDRGLCQTLAAHGIPAVALNSLHYFWKKRTPEGAAGDLQRILEHYRLAWRKEKFILIGYSMGAEVLPFMLSRLPRRSLGGVALVAFLGPGREAEFQFHLTQWLGRAPDNPAMPVQPEIEKLKGIRMLCFAGDEDKDAICGRLDPGLARRVTIPGGHRIGTHYLPVADAILKEVGLQK